MRYRDYTIGFDMKPIPDRSHDWEFLHDGYDGAPDSNDIRCGTAASLLDCYIAIHELEAEDGQS
jgi:hypothetical protein